MGTATVYRRTPLSSALVAVVNDLNGLPIVGADNTITAAVCRRIATSGLGVEKSVVQVSHRETAAEAREVTARVSLHATKA